MHSDGWRKWWNYFHYLQPIWGKQVPCNSIDLLMDRVACHLGLAVYSGCWGVHSREVNRKPCLQLLVWFPDLSGYVGQGLKAKLSNYCAVAVITNINHFTLSYTCTEVHMGDTCTKMLSQSVMTCKCCLYCICASLLCDQWDCCLSHATWVVTQIVNVYQMCFNSN